MTGSISKSRYSGFTLVELSIALVIISLLVGGILAGQQMIRASQLRASIHQLDEFDSAVNNFRSRFAGIPGDLSTATSHIASTTWPLVANGDNSGFVGDDDGNRDEFTGEISQFFYQLHATGMLDQKFTITSEIDSGFPSMKLGRGGIAVAGIANDGNFYRLCTQSSPDPGTDDTFTTSACLTPEEAWTIDQKIDDGVPLQGNAIASGGTTFSGAEVYYLTAEAFPVTPPVYASLWLTIAQSIIGEAFAAQTTVLRDACVFKSSGIADASARDAAATYAVASGGVNCQMTIRIR